MTEIKRSMARVGLYDMQVMMMGKIVVILIYKK
jgi:hypothetical protein